MFIFFQNIEVNAYIMYYYVWILSNFQITNYLLYQTQMTKSLSVLILASM